MKRISSEQKQITPEDAKRKVAELIISPETAAMRVLYAVDGKHVGDKSSDMTVLVEELHNQAKAINQGDLSQAEAMLMNQAIALQTLFSRLAERSMKQEYIQQFETNMKMALRAQSQCRATLETLASIKNPPVIYARQANIAHGHQQVNNGIQADSTSTTSHAQAEKTIDPNELLEVSDGKRLDTGTKSAAINADQKMAAVGEINRPKDGKRKKHIGA